MTPLTASRARWTLAVTGIALFMTALDSLVVGVALHPIRLDLGGSIEALEWTVNAYTLAFAVLLMTGAALGDGFGRRRIFILGVGIFTAASVLAAIAPASEMLVAARALQGIGAAILTPLTLTLISEAFPPERRATALGIWGGITGLGVAIGPFVGGAVVEGLAWQWIFWINVPIGMALIPLAARVCCARRTAPIPTRPTGSRLCVHRPVRGHLRPHPRRGAGLDERHRACLTGDRLRDPRSVRPMEDQGCRADVADALLPFAWIHCCERALISRCSSEPSGRSLPRYSQYFQTAQGLGPFEAGARTLPWTAMPMIVAPITGVLASQEDRHQARHGGRPGLTGGRHRLDRGLRRGPSTPFVDLVGPFALAGIGMALVFPTAPEAVLVSVHPSEAGKASRNNERDPRGRRGHGRGSTGFDFAANGGYETPRAFTDGVAAALPIAAIVLAAGALLALLTPGRQRATAVVEPGAPAGLLREAEAVT